jgi:hypothetical protein
LALVWKDLDLNFKGYEFWNLKRISGKKQRKGFSTHWDGFLVLLGRWRGLAWTRAAQVACADSGPKVGGAACEPK